MFDLEKAIKKCGQFTYLFSNMDTIFIDSSFNIIWEIGHNQLPEILTTYVRNLFHDQFRSDLENSSYDVMFHTSPLKMNYISARIYDEENIYQGSLFVGPFLMEEPDEAMIQEVLFENKLTISSKHTITQYYFSLPLISKYKVKMFAEFLAYHTANLPAFYIHQPKIGEITYNWQTKNVILPSTIAQPDLSVDLIEKRYALQNELQSAVEHGNIEKAEKLFLEDIPSIEKIPDRIPNDPLRSEKNLAITLNTSLRLAAERGGLHPVYIHSISEKYAIKIEKTTTIQQIGDLRTVMLREYCEAVRKHSLRNYNYLIRKAIEYITFHLDEELSLQTISDAIHSSPSELSRKFKKETGHSITDFINLQRMNEAAAIIENRNLTITDIAQMVGFNDVNYFTKVFKKWKGLTPSEYRKGQRDRFHVPKKP